MKTRKEWLMCPHQRKAMKGRSYDPKIWEEHPCPCLWNFTLMMGLATMLYPIAWIAKKLRKKT